jgi:hypothetical protein
MAKTYIKGFLFCPFAIITLWQKPKPLLRFAIFIEQLQLQLQLQLQGLHGAFCNVNKCILNFSCVLQAWWKYVDNEKY